MQFNSDSNPTKSALYLVDRGMQGKYYRWYNADADAWGFCGIDMNEAMANKDKPSGVGFFPWLGPLTGPLFDPDRQIVQVQEDAPAPKTKASKAGKTKAPAKVKVAKQRTATVVAPKAAKQSKVTHPDGTVWFRADRQKWIAMMGGKQEAARPTAEACLKFLKKKYNVDGVVVK